MLNGNEGAYKTLLRTEREMKEEVEESKIPKADKKNSKHFRCLPYVLSFQPYYFVLQNIHMTNLRLCHHISTD